MTLNRLSPIKGLCVAGLALVLRQMSTIVPVALFALAISLASAAEVEEDGGAGSTNTAPAIAETDKEDGLAMAEADMVIALEETLKEDELKLGELQADYDDDRCVAHRILVFVGSIP